MTRREKRLKEVKGVERKKEKRKTRLVVDHHTICPPVFFKTAVFWLRRDITTLDVGCCLVVFVREWRGEVLQGSGSQILDPVLALTSGPRRRIPSGWFVDVRTESAPELRAHVGAYDGRRGGCGG